MYRVEDRLAELGIELPAVSPPVANYVSATRSGTIVYISGQLSSDAAGGIKGTVGEEKTLAEGIAAARLCAINLIAQIKSAAGGDLDRVTSILRLGATFRPAATFSISPQ